MTVQGFSLNPSAYPVGAITAWTDSISEIPDGWAICDGNNGTPNLLDTYPKSVPNSTTDPGGVGGTHSYSLAKGQLPAHGHSGSVDTVGDHKHYIEDMYNYAQDSSFGVTVPDKNNSTKTSNTQTAGSHSHSVSSGNVGSGNSIDNRPSSTEVAYIQKL